MWQAAIQGDVLDASGNRARSLSDTPTDDLDWLAFGIATVMAATARVRTAIDLSLLLLLVFTLAEPYGAAQPRSTSCTTSGGTRTSTATTRT